jgi:uncharacterized membrane protein YccF (DUF307 family)
MSTLGNILWIVLGGGIFLFLEYLLGGVLLCLTIVGIPFGIQCLKLSMLALVPFGKRVEGTDSASGFLAVLMNILWILFGGIALAVTHVLFGLLCAITIIGLPFARQHMKLATLALVPFGHTVRSS